MQIYGIDLAKEKFDVSFFDLTSKKVSNQPSHKVVMNNLKGIGKFLKAFLAMLYWLLSIPEFMVIPS